MAQQGENIKSLQEWFDDQMNRYLSNGGKIEDLDPNSQLAHTPDLLRKLGVELNEARDKQASIEQDIATLTSEIASLDEQIKEVLMFKFTVQERAYQTDFESEDMNGTFIQEKGVHEWNDNFD